MKSKLTQIDVKKAFKFIQYAFYIDTEALKKQNEDLKKELNLAVLMVDLMKSGQLWRNTERERSAR